MDGLMMDVPLSLTHFFDRAERYFADKTIVTATTAGLDRTTYGTWAARTRRLGTALDALGVSGGGRVATLAHNTARHLELYFAAPCSGRVLHSLNIRLFADQLRYIVNHAGDEVIFVDTSLADVIEPLLGELPTVRHVVSMDDGGGRRPSSPAGGPQVHDYEELIDGVAPATWSVVDERTAAAMCYTSGTTGHPKGALYSHRSMYLHTLGVTTADSIGVCERDVILPVVPMFHVNAWGLTHAAVATGASLVMPGPDLTAPAIARLLVDEKVTVTAGVPTIWMGVLDEIRDRDTSALRSVICGGSAVPRALSEAYKEATGRPIVQAWGMTETSPIASVCHTKSTLDGLDADALADLRATVGVINLGVDMRVVDPETLDERPWDGETSGELQVRGPWVISEYYDDERSPESFTSDGWLRTGDVATVDEHGYLRLVDRSKDVIKSGGEWISSVDLENELMAHPAVAEAAVIGVDHPRWQERPLACVVVRAGSSVRADELREFLAGRVAKWWLPDDIVFIDEVPKTATGKFSKKDLRSRFRSHLTEHASAEGGAP
ncbi:MAG: long-chain fatty acid--CoA ligase [Actinomycetota bacterium]|nr:long-chain fatty acid--CoA ligase [Actinomycetota bacterium]